jgi:hypothetical protein
MNNVKVNVPQIRQPVKKVAQDKINLARTKGEYAPKWTQKSAAKLTSKPAERSRDDEMMWA